jgi:hypothetical protein
MRKANWIVVAAVSACVYGSVAAGQQKPEKPASPAHLELAMEAAATTEEGYPSVLRVTVKNVGNVAVDMPMPVIGCLPLGGHIAVQLNWRPNDPKSTSGRGWGMGCGQSDMPSLMDRVRNQWIRLRPGESVTSSENMYERLGKLDPGTVEYWVEYVPPEASAKELVELQQAGYIVPTERIETAHQSFTVR